MYSVCGLVYNIPTGMITQMMHVLPYDHTHVNVYISHSHSIYEDKPHFAPLQSHSTPLCLHYVASKQHNAIYSHVHRNTTVKQISMFVTYFYSQYKPHLITTYSAKHATFRSI